MFLLYILCMLSCATVSSEHYYEDETLRLPLISQSSLKRKYLQKSREFITGLRSLVDNSHIPLVSMEHYVQIYSSVAEVEIIQEYLNPLEASRIEAEFYFQIQLSQAFVSLEVETNGHKLSGIILDKNQQRGKKLDDNEYEVIPVAYAEILEDVHDVMRLNLGVLSSGQRIRIVFRYLEQLERIDERTWKLVLKSGQFIQPAVVLDEEEYDQIKNENIQRDPSFNQKPKQHKNQPANKQAGWKIYGDIVSDMEIDSVLSTSHDIKVITQKRMTKQHSFMYFEVNLNGSKSETQNFEMTFKEVEKPMESAGQTQSTNNKENLNKDKEIESIQMRSYEQLVNSNDPSVQQTVKAFSRNNSQKYSFKKNVEEKAQDGLNYSGKITPSMRKQLDETEEEVICLDSKPNELFNILSNQNQQEIDDQTEYDLIQKQEKSSKEDQQKILLATPNDTVISTGLAYVGYDPTDGANPYVGLIRFPALKSLAVNDSQSECDSGLRKELLRKQHASINTAFLSQEGAQLEAGLENQIGKEQNHVKRLLLIVEDSGMASSFDSALLLKTAEELIDQLEVNILLNVVLIAKAQQSTITLLPEFISPNKMTLIQQLRENMISQNLNSYSDLETVDFPLEDILDSYFQSNNKNDSQLPTVQYRDYAVVLGSANYWNADAVLTAIGKSRNIRLMYVGIGQAVQPAFLERISQLLGEGNALSLSTPITTRDCKNQVDNSACNFSQFHQQNIDSQIAKIITQLITELNSTRITKYTIVYTKNHQEFVNSISSITTTAGSLTLSPSHTIYVHFNKSFKKLLHKSARSKQQSEAAVFILRAFDEENRVYESTVQIFFSQVKTTNTLHKLAAHWQIQNILSNALYRPEQAFHSQLIALNANAYDQILRLANKHSLLTEVTAFFLLDLAFLSCQQSQFSAFPPFVYRPQQPEEEHFNEFQDEEHEEDDEGEDHENNQNNNQNSRAELNTHGSSNNNNQLLSGEFPKHSSNPTAECQQMESPLDLQNIKFSKISSSRKQLAYRKKQNKFGHSLIDIFKSFESHYSEISFSVILQTTRSFMILLLSII